MDLLFLKPSVLAIAAGFVIDCILGDPQNPLHPVRGIGWLIHGFLKGYDRLGIKNKKIKFLYGTGMAVGVFDKSNGGDCF